MIRSLEYKLPFFIFHGHTSKMQSVFVLAGLFACALAAPSIQQRIVGGDDASRGQYPYQASLQYRSGGIAYSHRCGATVISPSWLLTSAQCRDSFDLSRYRVVAGLLNQGQNDGDVQSSGIEEFILHPEYHVGIDTNDIALLLLSTPLQWTDTVQPVKLPASGNNPSGDATLSSWGLGKALQGATLPLLSHDECAEAITNILGGTLVFDDTQICTGTLTGQKGGCYEDIGGSLVQNGVVIGFLSWTPVACEREGVPAVYTRTDSHNDFILKYVDDLP